MRTKLKRKVKVNIELIENQVSSFLIAIDEEQFELSMDVKVDFEPEHMDELGSSKKATKTITKDLIVRVKKN